MATKIYQNLIGGQWVNATSGKTFLNRNPANTDDVVGEFQASGQADVDRAVRAARAAFKTWRLVPAPKRGELLYRTGELLLRDKEKLARAMTREMGKVLSETRGDVQERRRTLRFTWQVRAGGFLARPRLLSCATNLPCRSACRWVCAA